MSAKPNTQDEDTILIVNFVDKRKIKSFTEAHCVDGLL